MACFISEKLTLRHMTSGHLCLELTEAIGWDQFQEFAEELTAMIGASVYDKAEGVEMRIWHLQFPTCQIRLVYDDFPAMVSLESNTLQGDDLLQNLAEQLKRKYEGLK
jgi:hypothetical protein